MNGKAKSCAYDINSNQRISKLYSIVIEGKCEMISEKIDGNEVEPKQKHALSMK